MNRNEIFESIQNNSGLLEKMIDNSLDDSKNYGQRVSCMILEYIISQNLSIEEILAKRLKDFLNYLKNGQKSVQKLKILQLLNEIVRVAKYGDNLFEILCKENLMLILLELIDKNRKLNILHIQVEKIVNTIVLKENDVIKVSLESSEQLNEFLRNTIKQQEKEKRQEHIGFIIQLASKFQQYAQEFVKEFNFEQEFIDFVENEHERQNIDFTQSNKASKTDEYDKKKNMLK